MRKILTLFAAAIVLGLAALIAAYLWGHQQLAQPLGDASNKHYLLELKQGDNARQIVRQINQHFSRSQHQIDYRLAQWLVGIDRVQAGVYEVKPSDSWKDAWQMIKAGKEKTFAITLIEGQTFAQWTQVLADAEYLDSELAADPQTALQQLSFIAGVASVEGLFLPETYHYRAHESDIDILRRAYNAMQENLAEVWRQRSSECPVSSPYDLLVLASIIEKETGMHGERAKVASVFANRLKRGMRLQSDPTTIYGIENFDGNLTRQHLREKTEFNTYRIDGLPPTPIAMPSLAAIRAAAHPATTDYLYFVANGAGEHVFSKTLDAHNRAVRKYQLNQ